MLGQCIAVQAEPLTLPPSVTTPPVTPMQTFLDAMPMAKEKMIAA